MILLNEEPDNEIFMYKTNKFASKGLTNEV